MQHQLEPPAQPTLASGHMGEELFLVLRGLRRGWYYIAISAVVGLALGLVYAIRATTTYQATARLLILEQGARLLPGPGGAPFPSGGADGSTLSTHVMIIRSPTVADRAITALSEAGIKGPTSGSLIDHLTVTVPDPTAKVLQIVYTAGTNEEAREVMKALIKSYEEYLDTNYQTNTGKTREFFLEARDKLSEGVDKLEKEFLEYRQKNPSYTTDDTGRSLATRRLAQLEEEANQVRLREFHLRSQLELARKLLDEGADAATVATILSRVTPLKGEDGGSAPRDAGGAPAMSHELLGAQLEDVAYQRAMAERLLEHLRANQGKPSAATRVSDREVAAAFNDEPETISLRAELERAMAQLEQVKKRVRHGADPAVTNARERVNALNSRMTHLWNRRKLAIAAELGGPGTEEAIRDAKARLGMLTATEASLRDHLAQSRAERLEQLRRERAGVQTPGTRRTRGSASSMS